MISNNVNEPYFSVIIACYNSENYIGTAIKSVIDQKFTSWELIVVDDCSTDHSYSIALSLSVLDPRIKVLRMSKNLGQGSVRNHGIKHASANWIAILDSDDYFERDKLLFQYYHIEDKLNKKILPVLVGSGVREVTESGVKIRDYVYPCGSKKLMRNLTCMRKFPPHSSIVYNACALKETGLFNINYSRAEDYDLWLRLSELGVFSCVDDVLVNYRYHGNNISNTKSKNGFPQDLYSIVANLCFRIRSNGLHDPGNNKSDFISLLSEVNIYYGDSFFKRLLDFKNHVKTCINDAMFYRAVLIVISNPYKSTLLLAHHVGIININTSFVKSLLRKIISKYNLIA